MPPPYNSMGFLIMYYCARLENATSRALTSERVSLFEIACLLRVILSCLPFISSKALVTPSKIVPCGEVNKDTVAEEKPNQVDCFRMIDQYSTLLRKKAACSFVKAGRSL